MKKQLCSLLTALALAVGLLPSAARAAENAPSFADVPAAAWYADAVQYVYENGLMTGVSESEFAPDGTATRGQIVTILWRLAGSPVVNYAMRYADADEGAWYGEAVRWAASTGVVTGYSESSFGPNDAITREQLAAILYRYIKTQGQGFTGMWYFPLRYDDAASISSWADEAMHWCVMKGLLNGTSETTLSPQLTATRAQLAAILRRFCELPKETVSGSTAQTAYDRASAYLTAAVSAPRYGSLGGEWTVLALARGGADTETAYFTDYYAALEQTVSDQGARIALVTDADGVNAAAIVAAINDGDSSIALSADKIDLNGITTVADTLHIGSENSLERKYLIFHKSGAVISATRGDVPELKLSAGKIDLCGTLYHNGQPLDL